MKKAVRSLWFAVAMYIVLEILLILFIPQAGRRIQNAFSPAPVAFVLALFGLAVFFSIRIVRLLLLQMESDARREAFRARSVLQKEHMLAEIKAENDMKRLQETLHAMQIGEKDEAECQKMIDRLLQKEASSLFIRYCPHSVIDALLYHKSLIMKEKRIGFSIVASVPETLDIDDFALIRVLSNVIDNAIEAVSSIEQPQIDIHLFLRASVLVCQVKNKVAPDARIMFGISSKKDKRQHGMGLGIVERTCTEHGGLLFHEISGGWCLCTATLCLDAQTKTRS